MGDCAWAAGGCPITKQNYIDLVYSAIGDAHKGNWPRWVSHSFLEGLSNADAYYSSVDVLISQGWDKLLDWTKTGDTVPYTNFNDFLHYYP